MPNRRVALIRAVKIDGKWKYLSPVVSEKGTVSPEFVWLKGKKTYVSGGVWYIRWYEGKRQIGKMCGPSLTDARIAKSRQEQVLASQAVGLEIKDDEKRPTIDAACDQFIEDLGLKNRNADTIGGYRLVIDGFKEVCKKRFLDQIDKRDLLRYADSVRKAGLSPRTVSNRWLALLTILKANGITGLVQHHDAPKFVEEEPQAYTVDELTKFFKVCTDEQWLLFQFFLRTGFRMMEVMTLTWADLDFVNKTVSVRPKPQHGFRPKGWETRTVPLADALASRLESRRKEAKATDLVFPTRSGKLNNKMLQACKRIARRSGQEETQWWLHKFRATFCTMHADAGVPLPTLQMWMGHKDIATTMRYIRPNRSPEIQTKFNATFAAL
jgi:integrase